MAWCLAGVILVSLALTMPYHSTPCRRPHLKQPYGSETALWPFSGVAACSLGGLRRPTLPWTPHAIRPCKTKTVLLRPNPSLRGGGKETAGQQKAMNSSKQRIRPNKRFVRTISHFHRRTTWGFQRGRRRPQAACPPCAQATRQTAIKPFMGWPAHRA
jgi:hypothetical protein